MLGALTGCTSLSFYTQAIAGQWQIWRKQTPIEEVLSDSSFDQLTRDKLKSLVAARHFAHDTLKLPDNGSYRDYVELGRDYVVWNVFAAPELSLEPFQSCFLFAGCLSYRGYFSQDDAERFAATKRTEGFDVHVAGVAAYSTLGWFNDPVLSSILAWDERRIIEILFHELAHQQLHVADDTTFNESFAVAVAEHGMDAWLQATGSSSAQTSAAHTARAREKELTDLLLATRAELEALFTSNVPAAAKRQQKARIYAALDHRYRELKAAWNDDTRYDHWMGQTWNNARMSSIATYHELVPAFRVLLTALQHDYDQAYAAISSIAKLKPEQRHQCLHAVMARAGYSPCPVSVVAAVSSPRE